MSVIATPFHHSPTVPANSAVTDLEAMNETFWPLPQTAYEYYMVTDDRPSHPMTFCIELLLEGHLQREPLENSFERALVRHPLLRAVVQKRWLRNSRWVPAQISPCLEWHNEQDYNSLQQPPYLDICKEPGLRVWVKADTAQPRILFQFHHAAVDGVGAIEFIGDLLAFYGQKTALEGEETPEVADVDFNILNRRGDFSGRPTPFKQWFPGFARLTTEALTHIPRPLARASGIRTPAAPNGSLESSFPPFLTRILESDELMLLKKAAASRGVTPNELYTAVMFQTYYRWNMTQEGKVRGWARMCMPISLRTPHHDDIPSANIISYMLLNRKQTDLSDFDQTLKYVHEMSRSIIGETDGAVFVRNIALMSKCPGLVHLMTHLPICFSTGVLANVGDVKRQFRGRFPLKKGKVKAGNIVLNGLLGAAPVRPGSGIATSVGTYGRRLFINMNYDRQHFTHDDANQIIDLFVAGLKELIEQVK